MINNEDDTSRVMHDLRSPLNTISTYSQLLQRRCAEQLDENSRKYLDFIRQAVETLAGRVDDLEKYLKKP